MKFSCCHILENILKFISILYFTPKIELVPYATTGTTMIELDIETTSRTNMATETVKNTARIIITCIFVVFALLFGMICFNTATSIKMELTKIKVSIFFGISLQKHNMIYVARSVHSILSLIK